MDIGTNITIVGPGAIGGTVAAWLAQDAAVSVSVAVRTPFERLVVETRDGEITAVPRLITDPSRATPADWVMIATKTYDEAATKAWLAGLVGPETRVAVLQNGVDHVERFADSVAADRIVPVVVDIGAERSAPGRICQHRSGTMVVPAGPAGDAFAALFAASPIAVSTTEDFATAAWTKLAANCTGALNALLRKPAGIAARDDVAEVIRTLVRECIAVGRAEGATLDDDLADRIVARYRGEGAGTINSLFADFLAGRPMELDARNRAIVRRGARHGIATPMNALIVTLVEAASDRTIPSPA